MAGLGDLLGSIGSALSGPTAQALLPTVIESGLGLLSTSQANKATERITEQQLAFDREKLAASQELAREQLAAQEAASGEAQATARKRIIQEAFQALMEASLQGSNTQVTALNNLLTGAQRGL